MIARCITVQNQDVAEQAVKSTCKQEDGSAFALSCLQTPFALILKFEFVAEVFVCVCCLALLLKFTCNDYCICCQDRQDFEDDLNFDDHDDEDDSVGS